MTLSLSLSFCFSDLVRIAYPVVLFIASIEPPNGADSNNLADNLERLANLIDVVYYAILSDVQEDQIE